MNAIMIEYSSIHPKVRETYAWAGDDGRLAYRILIRTQNIDGQPIPIPFAREADAMRAAEKLKQIVETGSVPNEWNDLRAMLLEVLAW
jgi:hypothetical protein